MANGLVDVYGLRIQFRDHGRVWSVNIHYQASSTPGPTGGAADLVQAAQAAFDGPLAAARGTDSTLEGYYAWCTLKDTAIPAEFSKTSIVGTGSGTSLPPNTCTVFTIRSNDPGATRSGRIYLAGIPKGHTTMGLYDQGFIGALQGVQLALGTPLVGAFTWTPGILRKFDNLGIPGGPSLPLDPNEFSAAASVGFTRILYSQRRRNSRQIGHAA